METLGIVCLEAGEAPEAAESLARAMTMQERETSESTVATTTKLRIGDGRRILYRVHAFILMSDWPTAEAHLEGAIKVCENLHLAADSSTSRTRLDLYLLSCKHLTCNTCALYEY